MLENIVDYNCSVREIWSEYKLLLSMLMKRVRTMGLMRYLLLLIFEIPQYRLEIFGLVLSCLINGKLNVVRRHWGEYLLCVDSVAHWK